PLMDAEGGHRGIEVAVGEGELLGGRIHGAGQMLRALGAHRGRGLDGGDLAALRLVGAGAGTDVEHGAGLAERIGDHGRDPRVRAAISRVRGADGSVVRVTRAAVLCALVHASHRRHPRAARPAAMVAFSRPPSRPESTGRAIARLLHPGPRLWAWLPRVRPSRTPPRAAPRSPSGRRSAPSCSNTALSWTDAW